MTITMPPHRTPCCGWRLHTKRTRPTSGSCAPSFERCRRTPREALDRRWIMCRRLSYRAAHIRLRRMRFARGFVDCVESDGSMVAHGFQRDLDFAHHEVSGSLRRARSRATFAAGPPMRPRAQAAWPRTSGSSWLPAPSAQHGKVGIGADVAEGDGRVPRQAPPLGPRHGCTEVRISKLLLSASSAASAARGRHCRSRLGASSASSCWARRPGVGADFLADIAAVHPVAHRRAKLVRNGIAQLDGEVGDAGRRMDRVGGDDAPGRAVVDADRAPAAVPVEWRVGLEVEIEQHFAEQHPRAMPGHDQARILAVPAEPGPGRDRPLHDPGRIDQVPRLDLVVRARIQARRGAP